MKNLSEHARAALDLARNLAGEQGAQCVTTGHLIYGLTSDRFSVCNRIFHDINIYPEMFRDHLKKLPPEEAADAKDGLHPLVREAFKRAEKVRRALGRGKETTTDHVLIALLTLREGSAHECMKEFSVEPREIIQEVVEALGFEVANLPEF